MNMLEMMNKITQLSEAVKDTGKGKIHTAEPGGYGRKDDEDDEGNKVKSDVKKGRGRPKKDADSSTGEEKKYDTKGLSGVFGGGKAPKSTKKGTVIKGKSQSHAANKADDGTGDEEPKSKKKGLKEYFDSLDKALLEAEQIQIKPASQMPKTAGQTAGATSQPGQPQQVAGQPAQNTQVIAQGNKTLGTVNNPQLANQIKQSIGKGEMTLMPDEMDEGFGDTVKKIGSAIKTAGGKVLDKLGHGSDEDLLKDLQRKAGIPAHAQHGKPAMAHPKDAVYDPFHPDDKYDAANAANPPKAPSGQPNRMTPKPAVHHTYDRKAVASNISGKDSAAYDQFTGRDKVNEKDIGKHNNATTGFDALVRKLTPKYGVEAAKRIAGSQMKKIKEADIPPHDSLASPLSMEESVSEGAEAGKEELAKQIYDLGMSIHTNDRMYAHDSPEDNARLKQLKAQFAQQFPGEDAFKIGSEINDREYQQRQQQQNAEFKQNQQAATRSTGIMQKARGALSGMFEGSKKPDANKNGIPDYAEDGKGKHDLKKKKVKESMDQRLQAARLEGKAHGLKGHSHCGKNYDDMEEARCYHEGYKEGLDECYGQMPIQGYVGENDTVNDMASYGAHTPSVTEGAASGYSPEMQARIKNATPQQLAQMAQDLAGGGGPHYQYELKMLQQAKAELSGALDEMDKTAYMKQQAIKTSGDKFKAFGQTFSDKDVLESPFAFESLEKQLNALLEGKDEVAEGMTVSISKGQQGSPDSVSVSAQDGEADQLLQLIKSAGLGLFGGEESNGYGAPQGSTGAPGGIEVVDDHDGMMALMKKLTGQGGAEGGSADYADEEGSEPAHSHEEACEVCGESSCGCDGEQQMVDEVESEDQMTYNVAEDNPPDSGAADTDAEIADTNQANAAASSYDEAESEEEAASDETVAEDDDSGEDYSDMEEEPEIDGEELNEWANEAGKDGTDAAFEADINFMTKVISGGLNKEKSTGQTTIPVVGTQLNRMHSHNTTDVNESVNDWKKLAGIK